MKTLKTSLIIIGLLLGSMQLTAAPLVLDMELESYKVSTKTKKVDLKRINNTVKLETPGLPIEQLSEDFDSLLSENGTSDRESIEFEDDEISTASE